ATAEAIAWMKSLPLFLELEGFRFVHACWDEDVISQLQRTTLDGRLSGDQFLEAAKKGAPLYDLVETTTKGPETELPAGYGFRDKGGQLRREIRLQWWNDDARTWRDAAISVPDPAELPEGDLPADVTRSIYSKDADPVFFGHYWLSGEPEQQSPNALCLDYSAGKDGPLVAYRVSEPGEQIDLGKLMID
ncbi:metallophosphoesterase, partial [Aestuariicoccus sp. MJ-SS9]|nr:metallophosphoesterase [Aestuariicoccus sp. MJ-SS9]